MKKKITSLLLALVMCLGLCVPAFAASNQELEYKDAVLISVETFSNEELDKQLPEDVQQMLESADIMPLGDGVPDANSTWDLSSRGRYSFSAIAEWGYPIYSNYCFIGHNGAVRMYLYENTERNKLYTYTVTVYKRGTFNTSVYTFECFCYAGTGVGPISDFSSSDKIYFKISTPDKVNITSASYIEKY